MPDRKTGNFVHGVRELLDALVAADVDFVVCGGIACILHGVQRTTADLDCAVALDDSNIRRLIDAVTPLGYRLRAPEPLEALADPDRRRAWREEKGGMVMTLISERSPLQLDVFLHYPIPYEVLRSNAELAAWNGRSVRISSKPDLIAAKRSVQPQRAVDRRDVEDLEEMLRREA